jgi:hypothetical protein
MAMNYLLMRDINREHSEEVERLLKAQAEINRLHQAEMTPLAASKNGAPAAQRRLPPVRRPLLEGD